MIQKSKWLSYIHTGKALDLGEEFTSCVEQGEEVDTCTVRWEENQFHVARGSFKKQNISRPIVVCIKWRLRFVEKMRPHSKLNRTINGLRESLTSPDGTQGSTLSLDPLLVDKVVGGWRMFMNDCRCKIFWVIQIAWGQKGEEKKIEDEEQKKCIFLIPSRFLYCFIYFSSDWLQPGHHHR